MKGTSSAYDSYNSAQSADVKIVEEAEFVEKIRDHQSLPTKSKPNSVLIMTKDEKIIMERYFDGDGKPYLDIDYTNHGNSVTHPYVPHQHRWVKDKNGKIDRLPMEKIKND